MAEFPNVFFVSSNSLDASSKASSQLMGIKSSRPLFPSPLQLLSIQPFLTKGCFILSSSTAASAKPNPKSVGEESNSQWSNFIFLFSSSENLYVPQCVLT